MKIPIALLLSIVLIYVFDTNFDRGLKVRLFFLFATMTFSATSPEIGFIIVELYILAILWYRDFIRLLVCI